MKFRNLLLVVLLSLLGTVVSHADVQRVKKVSERIQASSGMSYWVNVATCPICGFINKVQQRNCFEYDDITCEHYISHQGYLMFDYTEVEKLKKRVFELENKLKERAREPK
jgi:hypothetical protein